jgi:hypothetical protein
MGLFDFLDDPAVTESLRDFCAEIDTDWASSRIAELLMSLILSRVSNQAKAGNTELEAAMMDRCAEIGSMINDYLRAQFGCLSS